MFMQYTSNNVVPGKEVPFEGFDNYILYLDPCIYEKPPFWRPILTADFFAAENRINIWGCSNIKLPLIVIVAP